MKEITKLSILCLHSGMRMRVINSTLLPTELKAHILRSFPGTAPPQASSDSYSPDSQEAVKYASASAEKWEDTSDTGKESPMNRNNALDLSEGAIMNTSHLFDEAAGLDLDA
eukprot:scaffold3651_cov128-Skeletonema_dohrnii-CCMP3373.AAC.5